MARRVLAAAVCALALSLLTVADAKIAIVTGFARLQSAINLANQYAKACKGAPGCLGKPANFTLTQDVFLTGSLYAIRPNAYLIIRGRCSTRFGAPRACYIDARGKTVFTTATAFGATSRFEIANLVIQNANGGVLLNMWSYISATNVTFSNNINGVVISNTALGGFPPRYFTNCTFYSNNGTAISALGPAYRLASDSVGYFVKNSRFLENMGDRDNPNGGAVSLRGDGYSVFQNTVFRQNVAVNSGGAVYVDQTSVKFKNVVFYSNVAIAGEGGAVAGVNGDFQDTFVNFCSGANFTENIAGQDLLGSNNLYFNAPPGATLDTAYHVTFCATAFPKESKFNTTAGTVVFYPAGKCKC